MDSITPPASTSSPPASGARWFHVLTPGIVTGFVGVAVILVMALAVGLANLTNLHHTGAAVAQTYSLRVALQRLLATMVDAETGERGFIITGAASYLEPY